MAVEAKRGCGYRKIGGTYLVSDPGGFNCGRLPIPLTPCPHCSHRPRFSRTIQRVSPMEIVHAAKMCETPEDCSRCPLTKAITEEHVALMWVGDGFYSPESFTKEALTLGVSKRISSVPKWLKVGETWIFLAHEKGMTEDCPDCQGGVTFMGKILQEDKADDAPEPCEKCNGTGKIAIPAVFHGFIPKRIEYIIPDTMGEKYRKELEKRGLTLIEVPHDDPDH